MIFSSRNLSSSHPSIHPSFFPPWEYGSLPQSHRSLCSSQTSGTSAVSVSDLHSCVEQLRHKLNLSQYPHSLLLLVSLFCFSPPCLSPARLSAVFPSKGKLPPLHRRALIFHFQITVAHGCFTALLSFTLSFYNVQRDKHNRGMLKHNGHVDI